MLDETTCPVCGKDLNVKVPSGLSDATTVAASSAGGIWAVAHYLAHLVQQQDERKRDAARDHQIRLAAYAEAKELFEDGEL